MIIVGAGYVQLDLENPFESDECEPFQDGNGAYDVGEYFEDSTSEDYETWDAFIDSEFSQVGLHDPWEDWLDSDQGAMHGVYNSWEVFHDGNGIWDFYDDLNED